MTNLSACLPNTSIEIVNTAIQRGQIRYALFDFDGTVSLIREGWQGIMIPMMTDILMDTPHHEARPQIESVVADYVARLTGKQTIYQMIQLCEEITARGGTPREPLYYKHLYNDRLNRQIQHRIDGLKSGRLHPDEQVVPGTLEWLEILRKRGITCYLASGTDEKFVIEETELLRLTAYFSGIYGAQDNYRNFSKKLVIDRICQTHQLQGAEFVAFGDGYVEIENAKAVGGIAVGVASDEKNRCGIDTWKRTRLITAGADVIIPDFREYPRLEDYLFPA